MAPATFTFTKAERRRAKLRLGLVGPAGSGKTYTALLLAGGIGGRIALIDTEQGSGELYAGRPGIPQYDVARLVPPYEPERYIGAIKAAEAAGYDVVIIDSLSHAWSGEGGCLDIQGKIADSGKGNSYTAWRNVTPRHNALVEALLASTTHLVATMRAKTEYALVDDGKGHMVPKKIGMAPVQRDGMDYEFTVVLDLDVNHQATSTKDRTSLFDGRIFKPDANTGRELLAWLECGAVPENITTTSTVDACNLGALCAGPEQVDASAPVPPFVSPQALRAVIHKFAKVGKDQRQRVVDVKRELNLNASVDELEPADLARIIAALGIEVTA